MINLAEQAGEAVVPRFCARGQILESFERHQRVLVDGIAVIEVAHHHAVDAGPLRDNFWQQVQIGHRVQRIGAARQGEQFAQFGPGAMKRRRVLQSGFRIGRQGHLVARHENQKA